MQNRSPRTRSTGGCGSLTRSKLPVLARMSSVAEPAPFGALAVYVQMASRPGHFTPSAEWAELDAYADRRHVESDGGFFHALGSLKLDKSILLQLDGRRDAATFVGELGASLEAAFNGNGAGAKVVEALTSAITDSLPAAGAQLYMTCDRKNVHVAYGFPADGKRVETRRQSPHHSPMPSIPASVPRCFAPSWARSGRGRMTQALRTAACGRVSPEGSWSSTVDRTRRLLTMSFETCKVCEIAMCA